MFHLYEKINNNGVYFIAEVSANHAGKKENILKIIKKAAQAGADCIKLQTYTADSLTLNCDNPYFKINGGLWDGYKLYDLYQEAGTPYEWHEDIKKECENCGIDFLSTPFDTGAVDFLEQLHAEAYKIASFELVDIPLIEYAASKGRPVIISTGMGSLMEIQEAVDACMRVGNDNIVLLKCCSEYPAPWADMHLGNIPDMKRRFQLPVGLSDHSPGSLGAVVGVALGACVIEKHVMLDGTVSPDSAFSMTMEEYAGMIRDVKHAKAASAGPDYRLTEGEKKQTAFRRSIFAVRDIRAGDEFTNDNLGVIRPGYGVAPKHLKELIGKTCSRAISRGEPVTENDLRTMQIRKGWDSFYSEEELRELGIKKYGPNVLISRNAVLYNPEQLEIGSNVRIDDFTTISGKVRLGNYIHIAQFCGLYGGSEGIFMEDFSGISSRVVIYAVSNDYSGESLTNPTVPSKYKTADKNMPVRLSRHVVVGTSSVIFPGVTIGEGSSVGALSLCTKDLEPWGIYAGSPARRIKDRSRRLLELEKDLLDQDVNESGEHKI